MDKGKLKERLIQEIQKIDDENTLKEVYQLLGIEADVVPYQLSEEQVSAVNEAREQIKRGQFITHEEAQEKVDRWLNK